MKSGGAARILGVSVHALAEFAHYEFDGVHLWNDLVLEYMKDRLAGPCWHAPHDIQIGVVWRKPGTLR